MTISDKILMSNDDHLGQNDSRLPFGTAQTPEKVEDVPNEGRGIDRVQQEIEEILNKEMPTKPKTDYDIFCEKYFYLFQPASPGGEYLGAGA